MSTITQDRIINKKSIFYLIKSIPQRPYFEERKHNIILFHGDCFDILSKLPNDSVDMIFDPPYFLSNGGITCHAEKMVSVNKGKWDISQGKEQNYLFTLKWLR
ncbi:MAG: hypothetical protein NC826_06785 [Candidatus Omnitrophica bacterium]|nr:hypothetical protein [Candidatus Omnitrophota bacterium]